MRSFECAKYEFRSKCVEPHTVPCPSQQPRQRCLAPFAPFERFAAQVVSVQLDQVERIQEHAAIVTLIPDALEQRDAILAARDCLTIEDALAGASRDRACPPSALERSADRASHVPNYRAHPRLYLRCRAGAWRMSGLLRVQPLGEVN
jgi:hypothetical protein